MDEAEQALTSMYMCLGHGNTKALQMAKVTMLLLEKGEAYIYDITEALGLSMAMAVRVLETLASMGIITKDQKKVTPGRGRARRLYRINKTELLKHVEECQKKIAKIKEIVK